MEEAKQVEALVEAAHSGDRTACAGLYEIFAARVLGYLRGLGVPDPEDTLGDVFVSALLR